MWLLQEPGGTVHGPADHKRSHEHHDRGKTEEEQPEQYWREEGYR
jgi:hypothetical protein